MGTEDPLLSGMDVIVGRVIQQAEKVKKEALLPPALFDGLKGADNCLFNECGKIAESIFPLSLLPLSPSSSVLVSYQRGWESIENP